MLIFRWLIPVLFVVAGVLFAAFMVTGNPRYKAWAWKAFRATLAINPVVPLVGGYHDILVYGRAPGEGLLWVALVAGVLLVLAWLMFRRASAEMVDVL